MFSIRSWRNVGLILLFCSLVAACSIGQDRGSVTTIFFDSPLLNKRIPFDVILPAGYERDQRRYPVLYLLHRFGDHYSSWAEKSNVVEYTRRYPLIIVMPEGGNGWYTNGTSAGSRWEDYLIDEVIPYIREHYRTLQLQRMSAVAGLSMGGYGALKLGLKYHNQFSFAASLSGSLRITDWSEDLKRPPEVARAATAAFGPEGSPARSTNSLSALLDGAGREAPFIYLDCGTEDALFSASRQFSALLLQKKIPHEYRERPGGHEWREWDHQIEDVLKVLVEFWHLDASVSSIKDD
jgi:putative tributyrin esterase